MAPNEGKRPLLKHFVILIVGTLLFMLILFKTVEPPDGIAASSDGLILRSIDGLKRGLEAIAVYMAFVALVLGHGLLRKSDDAEPPAE